MKYKIVKRIAFQGNSDKNLILRQQFGIRFLNLLTSGKRILNIDETLLSDTSFQRKKWRLHGFTNTVKGHIVNPRISLIAAVDTEWEIYVAISQVNTNNDTFRLYLSKLAEQLTFDRPNWRNDTIILVDGAQYHLSREVQSHMHSLGMKVIFTGPRSYDACPCELFYAYLKNDDLNPTNKPTGKK